MLSGHPKPALSQFSHGLQSRFLLAVESEKLQTEGAWVGSPNFNLGLKEFPWLQKSLPLSDKNHKTHRYTVRGKGHTALERELPSLLTSCPWIAKRFFNAATKSFTSSNFTETLFFKKKSHSSFDIVFVPKQKADHMHGEDSSRGRWPEEGSLFTPLPFCLLLLHWFLNHIPQPPFLSSPSTKDHTHLSLVSI